MQELNLDVAGDFMVMAATLIHIKSKMLVPIEPTEAEGDEEYVDPREELVRRLLEFQRYKEAAGVLHQQAQIRAAQWTRPDTVLPRFDDAGEEMLEAGLYDLIAAFKELLDRRKALLAHEVESEGPPVEQRMDELLAMIREGESLEFLELFASLETKAEMIVTFLALLELIRLKRVRVYQRGIVRADPGLPARGAARRGRAGAARSEERNELGREGRREGDRGSRRGRPSRAGSGAAGSALEAYVAGPARLRAGRRRRGPRGGRRPRADGGRARARGGERPAAAAGAGRPRGARLRLAAAHHAEGDRPGPAGRAPRGLAGAARGSCRPTTRATSAGCRSSRSPAATRSPRGPSTTTGSASCSTRARRRGSRSRPSRRSPSSPTSSRSPCPRSSSCAA